MALRTGTGLVVAALVAWLGALILGEYEFEGMLPFVAGPLFGLAIGEIVVGVGRSRAVIVGVAAGGLAASGIAWAGWIDSSEGIEPVKRLVWVAAALAAATAMARVVGRARPRGPADPPSP